MILPVGTDAGFQVKFNAIIKRMEKWNDGKMESWV
jgi:hypothetical protein